MQYPNLDLFGEETSLTKTEEKTHRKLKKETVRKKLLSNQLNLDVFRVPQPAFMSFSGGRTSALMLYYTLLAYDWKLPETYKVVFMNTGMERWETLDFVRDCGQRWCVNIHWLEWRNKDLFGTSFRQVSYENASRNGEPFAALLDKQGYCSNRMARSCTGILKIRVMRDFVRSQPWWQKGVEAFDVIGLRADEEMRVMRATDTDGYNSSEGLIGICPMADAGVTKQHVDAFWMKSGAVDGFDLAIPSEAGNCTLCFLKSRRKLVQLIRSNPKLADWWIEQERKASKTASGAGKQFNINWTYQDLLEHVQKQPELADLRLPDFNTLPCNCTD